nr:CinA family protein [Chthonobacter rhizosphaerae]
MQTACEQALTLATAESCTGGLIASLLTDVEGCSHAFLVGFVVYTEEAKTALLGVPAEMIEAEGVVSRSVAVAMAEGALARSSADIAISTTGYAGSAGRDGEPGLVHFACARRGRETVHREEHFGDVGRGEVRLGCLRTALKMMGDMLR